MTKLGTVALISLFISINSFANPCEEKLPQLLEAYQDAGVEITSHESKSCNKLVPLMRVPGVAALDRTEAPRPYRSNACLIILNKEGLADFLIIDTENDFQLYRSWQNTDSETYRSSRTGEQGAGFYFFNKSEGDYVDQFGMLGSIDTVTKAIYHAETSRLRLLKWDVGFFWNTWHNDYTLKCK